MNIRALCNNVTDGTDERQIDSCRHQKREESRRISLYQGDHSSEARNTRNNTKCQTFWQRKCKNMLMRFLNYSQGRRKAPPLVRVSGFFSPGAAALGALGALGAPKVPQEFFFRFLNVFWGGRGRLSTRCPISYSNIALLKRQFYTLNRSALTIMQIYNSK